MRHRRGGSGAVVRPPPTDAEREARRVEEEEEDAAATTTDEDGDEGAGADGDGGNGGGGGGRVHSLPAVSRRHQQQPQEERPAKRLKRGGDGAYGDGACATVAATAVADVSDRSGVRSSEGASSSMSTPLWSLERRVSPPTRKVIVDSEAETEDEDEDEVVVQGSAEVKDMPAESPRVQEGSEGRNEVKASSSAVPLERHGEATPVKTKFVPSPVQLTRIRDLPSAANVGAVALKDIVGDPLIVEMWQFNYMFDVDFLMSALDEDVRHSMRVKVVHGNWRREDAQRQMLEQWAKQHHNLEVIQAYMPEAFGTHHSKMMILIRADDSVQIVVHTANMIAKDWTNMTNAVWRSPLLPLLPEMSQPHRNAAAFASANSASTTGNVNHPIGTGQRFKVDLLRYLSAYGKRLDALTKQLLHHDFSAIRAALIASTPGRVKLDDAKPAERTSWGWPGLRQVLSQIPPTTSPAAAETGGDAIVAQVSSIATLDQAGAWLTHFRSVLDTRKPTTTTTSSDTIATESKAQSKSNPPTPFHLVFPTVADVRAALDGYRAGASIHFKAPGAAATSAARQKQLAYLRPLFCRWNNTAAGGRSGAAAVAVSGRQDGAALRAGAAPHVKTYVRYETIGAAADGGGDGGGAGVARTRIEWAMLTSANLSTQAWGALPAVAAAAAAGRKKGGSSSGGSREGAKEVRVCSWEIGVVVWPALFAEGDAAAAAVMVPVFGRDWPGEGEGDAEEGLREGGGRGNGGRERVVVGWRMPYDWPLAPYREGDEPWCPNARYTEPDGNGCVWDGVSMGV